MPTLRAVFLPRMRHRAPVAVVVCHLPAGGGTGSPLHSPRLAPLPSGCDGFGRLGARLVRLLRRGPGVSGIPGASGAHMARPVRPQAGQAKACSTYAGKACFSLMPLAFLEGSPRRSSWGSQSWLQTAFGRLFRSTNSRRRPERPPGKAAAGTIARPTTDVESRPRERRVAFCSIFPCSAPRHGSDLPCE